MSGPSDVAGDQLRTIVERIENIEEEIKELTEAKKEVYLEAKGNGFDVRFSSRSDPGAQAGPEGARRAGDPRRGLFTGDKGRIPCGKKGRILCGKGCVTEATGRWLLPGKPAPALGELR